MPYIVVLSHCHREPPAAYYIIRKLLHLPHNSDVVAQRCHLLCRRKTVGVARPANEPGAPTVSNVQVNGKSIEVGPFTTAGTYHIYCVVHQGMNLTVVVVSAAAKLSDNFGQPLFAPP